MFMVKVLILEELTCTKARNSLPNEPNEFP
jgi:hypothetical protein